MPYNVNRFFTIVKNRLTAPPKRSIMLCMTLAKKKAAAKKKATRERILEGAARVFANYSYYAASIRMVGKAARVDHPLVNYYFPTKAVLFEEVLKRITDELHEADTTWYEGLDELDLKSGLGLYLDRFIDFVAKHLVVIYNYPC